MAEWAIEKKEQTMLSDETIALAKARANYAGFVPVHQNNDCIRIAYAWLDAQIKTAGVREVPVSQRGLIRAWGGALVMYGDIIVAAEIHPDIRGTYPHLNLSNELTLPDSARLAGIQGANEHPGLKQFDPARFYNHIEKLRK
ncbi:hypothetical protein LG198_10900 [Methylobacillus arboreus]|uniref:hypothetical protein n=1 Tax=Methylobacillus arboreus TaxID=755170 RepID=UPI001E5DE5AE|nr:hypothetical protein [Methylobacillus arboreus]MCB5191236.1 hypothetical protein [Methylobacillus arboreus]